MTVDTSTQGSVDRLPGAWRALWSGLPVLTAGSVLVTIALALPQLLGPGLTPVVLLVSAVTVGPAAAALVAVANRLVLDGDARFADLGNGLRRHGLDGLAVLSAPAVVAAIGTVTLAYWQQTGAAWLLAPLGATGALLVLAVLGAVFALPLRVARGTRGVELWVAAWRAVAARPLVALGVCAAIVLGGLAATAVSMSLVVLVPGPVALLAAAGLWTVERE